MARKHLRELRKRKQGKRKKKNGKLCHARWKKPCRSSFVRSHASYWFAYVSFSLLHDSVSDQSNGIFSTTRVLDGRDPGDIGHFLVAIRQRKPPTVKTTGKEKEKRERDTTEWIKISWCIFCFQKSIEANYLVNNLNIAFLAPSSLLPIPICSRMNLRIV